ELSHDQVGDVIRNRSPQEDDPLAEQARVDVKRPLPAGGLLDDHWDQRTHESDSIERAPREGGRCPSSRSSRNHVRTLGARPSCATASDGGAPTSLPPLRY